MDIYDNDSRGGETRIRECVRGVPSRALCRLGTTLTRRSTLHIPPPRPRHTRGRPGCPARPDTAVPERPPNTNDADRARSVRWRPACNAASARRGDLGPSARGPASVVPPAVSKAVSKAASKAASRAHVDAASPGPGAAWRSQSAGCRSGAERTGADRSVAAGGAHPWGRQRGGGLWKSSRGAAAFRSDSAPRRGMEAKRPARSPRGRGSALSLQPAGPAARSLLRRSISVQPSAEQESASGRRACPRPVEAARWAPTASPSQRPARVPSRLRPVTHTILWPEQARCPAPSRACAALPALFHPPPMSPFAPSLSCAAAFVKKSLLLLPFITGALADLDNFTSPTYFFHTRPELHAPIVHFDILYPQLVSPGYIFVAPYRNIDPGPYIYDNHGELVWSGAGLTGPHTSHAPKVCEYQGRDHLCFFQGEQFQGFARGHGVIMDETYTTVKTIESGGSTSTGDMHEFRLIEGGKSALLTVYQTRQYDLAPYGIEGGMGWIVDSVFQEVDVETGAVNFEWRALDHISPSFTYTMAATTDTSGDGLTPGSPWDYFHINSIDKNADGDYLISARHTAAVYKLSGKDGHVIWELNGANPTFQNIDLHFSSQHHARWRKETGSTTILTLFDNASNNFNITNACSRGMEIEIDHRQNTAKMLREWLAPQDGCLLAGSQGNIQVLDDGHVFIGWGDKPFFSEHLPTGEAVSYGKIAQPESWVMNYRASKFQWKGTPVDNPALFTYSRTGTNVAGMAFYVSWNGATEVKRWDLYGSHTAEGPWERLASANRTGFETSLRIQDVKMFTYAEAMDADGRALRRSAVTKTFVPSAALMPACDDYGCMRHAPLAPEEHIENKVPYVANGGAQWNTGTNSATYYRALPKTVGTFLASIAGPLLVAAALLATLALCLYKHRARKGMSRARRTVSQTAVSLQEMMVPQGVRQQWTGKPRYARVDGDTEGGS